MTVIVGAEDKTGYWVGSDSIGSGDGLAYDFGSKLINKGNYVVAFANSYRVGDIIREGEFFPSDINTMDDLREFRDRLKEALVEDGCSASARSEETVAHPIALIIISSTGMFLIESDYQLHKVKGYIANGSGADIATGALRAALSITGSAEVAVRKAIDAAIHHSTTCGGRAYVEFIPKKRKKKKKVEVKQKEQKIEEKTVSCTVENLEEKRLT